MKGVVGCGWLDDRVGSSLGSVLLVFLVAFVFLVALVFLVPLVFLLLLLVVMFLVVFLVFPVGIRIATTAALLAGRIAFGRLAFLGIAKHVLTRGKQKASQRAHRKRRRGRAALKGRASARTK